MNERDTTQPQTQNSTTNVRGTADATTTSATDVREDEGFFPEERMDSLRDQWSDIQTSFVDNPQSAVQRAHQLVTSVVNDLTDIFTRERSTLEGQWSGGGQADTEALRVAMQRYRSFFNRLLGTSTTTTP
jgi:hypothetical protein